MARSQVTIRTLAAIACAVMVAGVLLALPTYREHSARAHADEVRRDVARSYREARSWRAHVQERELVREGVYRTTRYQIIVAGPDRYRVEAIEQDERGREVTAVTIRDGSTVYSSTQIEGEAARVLEVRNVPPALGAITDNVLGQRVRDLARAASARYVGREDVRGRSALKLAVEPGHVVWVDGESSIPVREQLLAADTVTHELEVLSFEQDAAVEAAQFDRPSPAGALHTVEDLGFRPATTSSAPASLLGFVPRAIVPPAGWSLVGSGYTEPGVHGEAAPATPAWIAQYDTPHGPVLVTQSKGLERDAPFEPTGDGTDGPEYAEVDGRTVAYFADEWRTHATIQVEDVLVVIEGLMGPDALLPAIGYVR